MSFSKIEWTNLTWNPVTGCTKCSPGCTNCYAERMAKRLTAIGSKYYRNGFKLTTHQDLLSLPLRWKKPRLIFVNSMSDLFHEDVPFAFIRAAFNVMLMAEQHIFQILTKRSSRLFEMANDLPWPKNIWMGVSVENSDYLYRLEHLSKTKAMVKFVSFEPLLGPIVEFDIAFLDWVIVGGESGPKARPIRHSWVECIRDLSLKNNIPFFFKQWGGVNKKKTGRTLGHRTWDQMPHTYTGLPSIAS